jgi:hypothetical protein
LLARGDADLREHLPQVVRGGVLADEEPLADLGVRQPLTGEARDLSFLSGQFVAGQSAAAGLTRR